MKCNQSRGVNALANMTTSQYLLSNQCHHDGVIDVVVRSITISNIFQCEPSNKPDDARIAWLQQSIRSLVHDLKLFNKRFDHNLRRIEHRSHLKLVNK
jgi:hypothetical protein